MSLGLHNMDSHPLQYALDAVYLHDLSSLCGILTTGVNYFPSSPFFSDPVCRKRSEAIMIILDADFIKGPQCLSELAVLLGHIDVLPILDKFHVPKSTTLLECAAFSNSLDSFIYLIENGYIVSDYDFTEVNMHFRSHNNQEALKYVEERSFFT